MSRVGRQPVVLPKGVKASCGDDLVKIEGPAGTLTYTLGLGVTAKVEGDQIVLSSPCASKQDKANFGAARSIINNMVHGVVKPWKKAVELNGVGFAAQVKGSRLELSCGFSHEVSIDIPKGVKCTVTKNVIDFESADRELVGGFASKIRKVQPAEPYLGKGIKYVGEVIRRKAGKAAAKKA